MFYGLILTLPPIALRGRGARLALLVGQPRCLPWSEGPLSLVREGNNHREPGYERVDALLADVEAAGSWAVYAREPRRKMLVLAKLCEKGRATPPRRDCVLGTLFDGGSRRGAASVVILREVFWKVFEFWPCSH